MVYWSLVILTVDNYGYYNLFMVYWSTVIFKVDNDGYYNRHHRTYLWYTGLP